MNFLTDPLDRISTLRFVDVMIYRRVRGKHVSMDLIEVSPLVRLRADAFTVGQTTLKDSSSKVTKYEKACSNNQHVFILFAFDTFWLPSIIVR